MLSSIEGLQVFDTKGDVLIAGYSDQGLVVSGSKTLYRVRGEVEIRGFSIDQLG